MVWKNRYLTGTKPPDTVWGSYHFPSNFHNKATGPALKAVGLQSISPSGAPVPVRILFPVHLQQLLKMRPVIPKAGHFVLSSQFAFLFKPVVEKSGTGDMQA